MTYYEVVHSCGSISSLSRINLGNLREIPFPSYICPNAAVCKGDSDNSAAYISNTIFG